MTEFDIFFRFMAIGLLLVIAALLVRDARHVTPGRYAVAVCICAAAYLLRHSPMDLGIPTAWQYFLLLFNMQLTIVGYWFGRSLLDDNFRLTRIDKIVFSLYFLAGIPNMQTAVNNSGEWEVVSFWLRQIISLAVIGHLLFIALAGRSDDLIEARRRMRTRFAIAIALTAGVNIVLEIVIGDVSMPGQFRLFNAIAYAGLATWGFFWVGRMQPQVLMFEKAPIIKPAPTPVLNPKEAAIHTRLQLIMSQEKAYAQQGLTIRQLAKQIDAPEHQLRALINKSMGHRNFSAFLNTHRIEAAKLALTDPAQVQLPVLTIAMDVGYASLAPFNRAFRTLVGEPPTAFRRKTMGEAEKNTLDSEKS